MKRSGLQKFFAACMLVVLFGSVISKDLYHIILPHKQVTAAYVHHLSDPNTTICSDQHQSDCYFCHFEFSSGDAQAFHELPDQVIQIGSDFFSFTGHLYTSTCILNLSLRAPPTVI